MDDGRPRRHQYLRHPRGRRAEGHRPPGAARPAQGRQPRDAGRDDRLLRARGGARRAARGAIRPSTCSCGRTRSRSSSIGWGSPRPRARSGAVGDRCDDDGRHGPSSASRTGCPRRGPGPWGRGPSRAGRRSAPGCRSSTAATRPARTASSRSAAGRSAAARSTTSSTRREPSPRRATARSRCSARTSTRTATTCAPEARFAHVDAGALGRPPAGPPRPAGPRRAHPGDRRPPRRRTAAGHPAPALRDLAPVGPVRPTHRGAGRLPERVRAPAPAGPVRRRRGPPPDGSPVHDRALPRAPRPDPRGRPGHHHLDRHHRRVLRRDRGPVPATLACSRPSATTRSSPRRTRRARARRRRASPTTSRRTSSARASTSCCASRRRSACERNEAWLGRDVEVLVDTVDAAALARPRRRRRRRRRADAAASAGRTRGNKLVHLPPATARWSVAGRPSASSTPARTRLRGRSSRLTVHDAASR